MKKVFWLRKTHKWLALAAGIQIMIWAVSGLYMTIFDIDVIHGDHLVNEQPVEAIDSTNLVAISNDIIKQYAPIQSIRLKVYFGRPVYEIRAKKVRIILDANTGEVKSALNQDDIEVQAKQIYAGEAKISTIQLLDVYPGEIGGRKEPVWQVNYDDNLHSTLYFQFQSGRLVSKRTDLWRAFDVLWILHIMDFLGSRGHTGIFFRFFSIASMLMAFFGTWLLFFRLKGDQH